MPDSLHLSLFEERNRQILSAAGFVASMKAAMRRMLDGSGLSRAQVVDVMNDISKAAGRGRKYSVATLEKWAADEERGQLPNLWDFEVLQLATGSRQGLEAWLALHGLGIMDEAARKKVAFAELEIEREANRQRRQELKKQIKQIGEMQNGGR